MKKKIISKGMAMLFLVSALAGCGSADSGKTTAPAGSAPESSTAVGETAGTGTEKSGPKTITMAMVSAWDTLVPFDTTSSYSDTVLDMVFDKLVYLKQDGTYEPRLADSWEMSDDNKVLTVHLNENAKWQDGQPVTADDVVFTCKVYGSPTVLAVRQNNVSPFAGFKESDDSLQVEAVDSHTVKFTCAQPTNMDFLFFIKFRDIYILPKHLLGDTPLDKIRESSYWEKPVGSGPCVYESQISGERIEFAANKDYYLKSPDWDRFVVKVVATPSLLSGLMNNEIDILAGNVASLPLSDWDMAKQQQNLVCESTKTVGYQYMAINTSKDYLPAKVRQAINMAINREAIVNGLLKGQGEAAFSPFSKEHKYYNDVVNVGLNTDKAKELLKEAGWDGSHELVFSVPTGNTIREQAAVIIQQNLQEIGIKTKIESADFAAHLTKVRNGEFDLGLIGSGGSPDPSECVINFKPDHINNFSHLSDWTIYDTGAAGEQAFSFEDRKVSYDKYQGLLTEQVPFCFLYFQNNLFAHNKRIENIKDNQDYSQLNRDVWNWTVTE
ncbi:MAG: ABC transporter substrate-binding protein [Lacrimispora sp.]|uniref:ABC transporter substrate-binding protein n=1 Tax=Lacrimispora sp. TaxID=2719234 RepID=UPI0039E3C121